MLTKIFSSLVCLLFAFSMQAQPPAATVTVEGIVTLISDGSPVKDWNVYASSDSLNIPNVAYGKGTTDANGHYSFPLEFSPGGTPTVVFVSIFSNNCVLPDGTILGETKISQISSDLKAITDFGICDLPPIQNCWVDAWYYSTGGYSIKFQGNAKGLDPTTVFDLTWDFGDGTTGTGENPTHEYATDGIFNVTLTANSADCSVTTTLLVFVKYTPPMTIITVSGYVFCNNDSTGAPKMYVLAGSDPNGGGYGITDNNGYYEFQTSVAETDSIVNVQTFSNWGIAILVSAPIVNGAATANFSIDCDSFPPVPDCQVYFKYLPIDTNSYQFYSDVYPNNPGSNVSYFWDFGDGSMSNEANPTHTYSKDGIYTVSLTTLDSANCKAYASEVLCDFNNGGGDPIDTFWYGCQAMFFAGIAYDSLNPNGGFDDKTLQFFDASLGKGAVWEWFFGDGSTSSEQNPVHTYAKEGVFTVTLRITTADGCESKMAMEVYVGSNIWNEWDCQAMFLPVPGNTKTEFQFVDLSFSTNPVLKWYWNFGDGSTSSEQNPFHTYSQPGIYKVSLEIGADSCNSVIAFELDTENPLKFAPGDNNGAVLGLSSLTSKTNNPNPVFDAVKLFPNPSSDVINLVLDSKLDKDFELKIIDLSGRVVISKQEKAVAGTSSIRINVSELNSGLYQIQLKSKDSIQTVKMVIGY